MRSRQTLTEKRKLKELNYERAIDLFYASNGSLTYNEMADQLGLKYHDIQYYLKIYFDKKKML